MASVMGLFPTPVMRVDGLLDDASLKDLLAAALAVRRNDNSATDLLSHTAMMDPQRDDGFRVLVERTAPHLVAFGEVLFAERRDWLVKEAWMNVLETGGSQFMHTHANSFVSGIVYLTTPHPSAHTMFRKPGGGAEFIFKNDVPLDHYSSDTWLFRDAVAGDLLLYPSYLSHGVPPNQGGRRVTLAFNAIPDRLDSLGYRIRFGA